MSYKPEIPVSTRNIETGYTVNISDGELVTTPSFTINSGTTFNGTDQRVSSDASVSSNWGTTLTYSIWVNVHSIDSASSIYNNMIVRQFESEWLAVERESANYGKLYLDFFDTSGNFIIKQFISTDTVFSSALNTWHHVLVSLDTNSVNCYVYFNGSLLAGTWLTNWTNGFDLGTGGGSTGYSMIMAQHSTVYTNCSIAEFWASKEAIDITNATNRERFRDASGNAVYLGTDGSLASPTSTQPELYYNDAATTASTANAGSYVVDWNPLNSPTESATLPPHISEDTKIYTPDLTQTNLKFMGIDQSFTLADPALGATKGGACEVYLDSDGDYTITEGSGVTIVGDNTLTAGLYLLTITSFGTGKTIATLTSAPPLEPPSTAPISWEKVGSGYKRVLTEPVTNAGFNHIPCSDSILSSGYPLVFEAGRLGTTFPGLSLRTGVPVYFDISDYKWKHRDGTEIEYPPDEPPYILDGSRFSTIRTSSTVGSEGEGDRSYHYMVVKLDVDTFLLRRTHNLGNTHTGFAAVYDAANNLFTWRNVSNSGDVIRYYNQTTGITDGENWNGHMAGDGNFYALGGNRYSTGAGLNEICRFNPETLSGTSGHWTQVGTLDLTFGNFSGDTERTQHFAIGLDDGRIWFGGGVANNTSQYRINTWYFDYTQIGGTPITNGPNLPVDNSGTHTGGDASANLIDSNANFSGIVNRPLLNLTQGWQTTVSSIVSPTEITYVSSNTFDTDDEYAVLIEGGVDHFRQMTTVKLSDGRIYLVNNSRALIFDPTDETFIDSRTAGFSKLPSAIDDGSITDKTLTLLPDGRMIFSQLNAGVWLSINTT